jgi:hypothetical protein
MIWIILSTAFVVSFPTIASAMTGYSSNSKAYVQDVNGNLIPWNSSIPQLSFVIHDGQRVNLGANHPVLHTQG